MEPAVSIESLETTLLLETIFQRFHRDFRYHNRGYIHHKLQQFIKRHAISTLSALQEKVLHSPNFITPLLCALDERQSSLFAYAEQIIKLRQVLIPWLRSCPAPKIWLPDCVQAEDIFTLAILLLEENVLAKTHFYVTGPNVDLLADAKRGRFPAEQFSEYDNNYRRAGGINRLADYCTPVDREWVFNAELSSNITWTEYHLATDASLNEFEAIICCGEYARFSPYLRQRAINIFYESQPVFGLLVLMGEQFTDYATLHGRYRPASERYGIFRRLNSSA